MSSQITTPGKAVNEASPKLIKTRSQFDLSYKHFDTHRFGEYHPHFYFEGVPDDKNITLNSSHTLRSYTLGAPLMQDIQLKKDYFGVPLSAIIPFNWEKWYKNPNRGDDVADEVGPCVTQFWIKVGSFCSSLLSAFRAGVRSDGAFNSLPSTTLTAWFRMMVIFEMFYSNGSLLKTLGISGTQFFSYVNISSVGGSGIRDFDFYFDTWINFLQEDLAITELYVVDSAGHGYYVDFDGHVQNGELAVRHLTLNGFLSLLRDDLNLTISSVTYSSSIVSDADEFMARVSEFISDTASSYVSIYSGDEERHAIDLSRIFAYQIACAHFYSNENVDDIYSAELYRELIGFCVRPSGSSDVFSYNGLSIRYDWLSGHYFSLVSGLFSSTELASVFLTSNLSSHICYRGYFSNVFSFRRSLKFMDYFTGARTQPLAVGDSTVAVNSSKVNVIDMASGFQKTRFWNAVSRTGSKIRNYMREVMGVELPSDIHDPYFLGHTSDSVFGQEVENTADGQLTLANSVTSVLRSNASRYAFNFDVDVPICIIGISYYDIPRIYTQSTDRTAIGSSRFDKFNPFLQFVGDQPLYNLELGNTYEHVTFGYQLRDMQYKQKFPIGTGGFVNQLPGFCFIADDTRYGHFFSINEEYVRSLQSELDKYYVSLTGHSLGSYFHFIVKTDNKCTASRPMVYAPSIL